MSRHEGCDRCTETAAVVRREVAALTAERDEARAKLDDGGFVWVVTEDYGEWELVAVYDTLEAAQSIEPNANWQLSGEVWRNFGPGRDLFVQQVSWRPVSPETTP